MVDDFPMKKSEDPQSNLDHRLMIRIEFAKISMTGNNFCKNKSDDPQSTFNRNINGQDNICVRSMV